MIENAQLIGLLGIVVWGIGVVGVMLIPENDKITTKELQE